MKRAGYDALIIEGKAEEPTYLWIKNGEVKFPRRERALGAPEQRHTAGDKGRAARSEHPLCCIGPAV
jgi:aldehyde:ferredoxin oxidoreductase